jgi:hypothetical protein
MNKSPVTFHYRSTSQLVVDAQRPYRVIIDAIEALGIAPAVTIDGTRYYHSDVADAIRTWQPPAKPRRAKATRAPREIHTVPDTSGNRYIGAAAAGQGV